jgi:hypothetical protein
VETDEEPSAYRKKGVIATENRPIENLFGPKVLPMSPEWTSGKWIRTTRDVHAASLRMVEVVRYGEGVMECERKVALLMTFHPCVVATSR